VDGRLKQTRSILFFICVALLIFNFAVAEINRSRLLYAEEQERDASYLAPFVATTQELVDRMLELAEIKPRDILYDLGSGDGRIVITAAKSYGIKAVGFEIDPSLVKRSRAAVKEAGLEALAEIREEDIRYVDLTPATVVTMYLYPWANLRLRDALMSQLKLGARVVSHEFAMGSWQPDRVERIQDSAGLTRTIYLWRIKERAPR
jgi:hypothetical protein